MACRYRTPLAELLEFGDSEAAAHCQNRIEHRRHVAGVEIETVACKPHRVVGIVDDEARKEHIDEVGATHGASGMTRFGFFYHCCRQNADIVGCVIHGLDVHIGLFESWCDESKHFFATDQTASAAAAVFGGISGTSGLLFYIYANICNFGG